MKQIRLEAGSLVDNVSLIPPLKENEVLVKIEACGVCYRDIIDKEGGNRFLPPSITLGHEIAGEVIKSSSPMWSAGDRVVNVHGAPCGSCSYCITGNSPRCTKHVSYTYGMFHDGGYQEYTTFHPNSLVRLHKSIDFAAGCFLCCTAAVSIRALKLAGIKQGDKVVITGASGGVGVHALQVAAALGAMTICITSNTKKVACLIALGAGRVIVSDKDGFHKQVLADIGPVDIVLELVGGPTFASSMKCLKPTGTVVVVGNVSVSDVSIKLGKLILFEQRILGSSGATKEDVEEAIQFVLQDKLRPIIWKEISLSLQHITESHNHLKNKEAFGRIVIRSSL